MGWLPINSREGVIGHAIVDDDLVDRLSIYRWRLDRDGYVIAWTKGGVTVRKMMKLHRIVMDETNPKVQIDHIDRDKRNNLRSNLRQATNKQNGQNVPARDGSSSNLRGVSWDNKYKKWRARAKLDDKEYILGYFDSEIEAGKVALEWRQINMEFSYEGGVL